MFKSPINSLWDEIDILSISKNFDPDSNNRDENIDLESEPDSKIPSSSDSKSKKHQNLTKFVNRDSDEYAKNIIEHFIK